MIRDFDHEIDPAFKAISFYIIVSLTDDVTNIIYYRGVFPPVTSLV